MSPEEDRTSRLRETARLTLWVAATSAAAIGCLGATGLIPTWVGALSLLAVAGAAAADLRWSDGPGSARRRGISRPLVVIGLLGLLVMVPLRVQSAAQDVETLVTTLGTTFAYPLILVIVAQIAAVQQVRDVVVLLVADLFCVVLAVGTRPPDEPADLASPLGAWLLATYACGMVSLWLLHRAAELSRSQYVLAGGTRDLRTPLLLVTVPAVVGLGALLLLPTPEGVSAGGRGLSGYGQGPGDSGTVGSYLSPWMNLGWRGDLPSTPVLDVPADGPQLWGSTQLSIYDGRTWRSSDIRAFEAPANPYGLVDLLGGTTDPSAPRSADRKDVVHVLERDAPVPLVAPGQQVWALIASPVVRVSEAMHYPRNPVTSYVMSSSSRVTDGYRPQDTELPPTVPPRVHDLARRLTRDEATVAGKVRAIETWLGATMRYRLDVPVPRDGQDAVDHFLFDAREGFCEQFATAEAVLLRAVGIPTRVVTGFAYGTVVGDRRILSGDNAHAWVQVYVGDGRWIWSDPTAGARLAEQRADVVQVLWNWTKKHGMAVAAGGALVVGLVLTALLGYRVVRSRRARARAAAASLGEKVLAAFGALETSLAGTPLARAPDTSVAQFQRSLARRWPNGLPDPEGTSSALEVVQRVLYDSAPVDASDAERAITALERLTASARETSRRRPTLLRS